MSKEQFIQTIITIIILGAIFLGLSALGFFTIMQEPEVSSFEECIQHYPVMESYPRQCMTPLGQRFVEDISCIQVITPAYNPTTGEVKEFSTPCDIPEGWVPNE